VGDDGRPRLVDFGLAAPVASADLARISGTLPYMAPEQARGQSERIDPRTDVYGVGAVLYEILTGRPPHQGASREELWRSACAGDVVPPRQLNGRVPGAVNALCLRCLAKDPTQRFASAAELAGAVRRWQRWRRRLMVVGPVAAFLLAAVATWLLAAHLACPSAVPVAQPGTVAQPLSGELSVLVWAPDKRGLRVQEWGALPVRNKEQIQVEVRLNQPAHAYLLWIDSEGVTTPLYPWNEGIFITQKTLVAPPVVGPQAVVQSPGEMGHGWIVGGKRGLDTILLLARQEPLPADVALADLVGPLPATKYHVPTEWAVRGPDGEGPVGLIKLGDNRAPDEVAARIDDPLLQLMSRLRPHFEAMRAVRFAHEGD
jgi:hypothetical protein